MSYTSTSVQPYNRWIECGFVQATEYSTYYRMCTIFFDFVAACEITKEIENFCEIRGHIMRNLKKKFGGVPCEILAHGKPLMYLLTQWRSSMHVAVAPMIE